MSQRHANVPPNVMNNVTEVIHSYENHVKSLEGELALAHQKLNQLTTVLDACVQSQDERTVTGRSAQPSQRTAATYAGSRSTHSEYLNASTHSKYSEYLSSRERSRGKCHQVAPQDRHFGTTATGRGLPGQPVRRNRSTTPRGGTSPPRSSSIGSQRSRDDDSVERSRKPSQGPRDRKKVVLSSKNVQRKYEERMRDLEGETSRSSRPGARLASQVAADNGADTNRESAGVSSLIRDEVAQQLRNAGYSVGATTTGSTTFSTQPNSPRRSQTSTKSASAKKAPTNPVYGHSLRNAAPWSVTDYVTPVATQPGCGAWSPSRPAISPRGYPAPPPASDVGTRTPPAGGMPGQPVRLIPRGYVVAPPAQATLIVPQTGTHVVRQISAGPGDRRVTGSVVLQCAAGPSPRTERFSGLTTYSGHSVPGTPVPAIVKHPQASDPSDSLISDVAPALASFLSNATSFGNYRNSLGVRSTASITPASTPSMPTSALRGGSRPQTQFSPRIL